MARIAFFSESLTGSLLCELSWQMVQGLLEQNHEVTILTSAEQKLDFIQPHPNLRLLQPFRRWSWSETIPVIPILLEFRPQILHFTQPSGQRLRGWTNSMNILGAVHEWLGRPLVVTSLFHVQDRPTWRQHLTILLRRSDMVTVTNPTQAELVHQWLKTSRPRVEVFPISLWGTRELPVTTSADSPFTHWVFVPGPVSDHPSLEQFSDTINEILIQAPSDWGVVIGGGWGTTAMPVRKQVQRLLQWTERGDRVLWTGEISREARMGWMKGARLIAVSTLDHSDLALTEYVRQALQMRVPLLLSHLQKTALDIPRAAQALTFVTNPILRHELKHTLREFPWHQPTENWANLPLEHETRDQSGNFLSRLYVTGLEQKQNRT